MEEEIRFPYIPREGQEKLIKFVLENEGYLIVNAPTGFGKTPSVLYPLLLKGEQIIWTVRTGNETDRPIEELKKMGGAFGLSLRGKRDMCLLAREYGEMENEEVQFLCQKKKKNCPYYNNLEKIDITDFLENPLLYSEILNIAKNKNVCPYYLQFYFMDFAQVVSLSYNYIFRPSLIWILRKRFDLRDSALVVDEAHNLQKIVMNLNHDEITTGSIERAMAEISQFSGNMAKEIWEFLEDLNLKFHRYSRRREVRVDIFDFLDDEGIIPHIKRYGTLMRSRKLKEGKRPSSSLSHIARFFEDSLEILGEGVFFILQRDRKKITLERWDARASELFKSVWSMFRTVIFMSGTLKPFEAFMEIVGIEDPAIFDYGSFYDLSKIKVEFREKLTTKGNRLSRDMAAEYVKDILKFAENEFNIAVFTASYRIQKSLLRQRLVEKLEDIGRRVFIEAEGMRGDSAREILDEFRESAPEGVLIATATGRFAEGADFPGESLVGIYLVGIPFERMTLKTRLYLEYYRKLYGSKGRYYGYVIPAMRRASQALGRALRSQEDRAFFVLGDKRYTYPRYFNLLPDYIRSAYLKDFESLKGSEIT